MSMTDEPGSCLLCDKALAVLGITLGLGLLLMGADLLAGGRLAAMLPARALAEVIPIRQEDDSATS